MRHVEFPSQELAVVAQRAWKILHTIASTIPSPLTVDIALKLRSVHQELEEQDLYQISPTAQDICTEVLRDLLRIFKWSDTYGFGDMVWSTATPRQLSSCISDLFGALEHAGEVNASIATFCRKDPVTLLPFHERFVRLADMLAQGRELQDATDVAGTNQYRGPPVQDVYSNEIHNTLLQGIKSQFVCVEELHQKPMPEGLENGSWHVTHLCLASGVRHRDQEIQFDIVTANASMTYWQEIAITLSEDSILESLQLREQFETCDVEMTDSGYLEEGQICKWLEDEDQCKFHLDLDIGLRFYRRSKPDDLDHIVSGDAVRLSEVLQLSDLAIEHKMRLSYAIVRAFWKFYSSEILGDKWTSEDIRFIALDPKHYSTIAIPLRPFVPLLPAGQHRDRHENTMRKDTYTHAFPHILHLGIILLEIGLGKNLRLAHSSNLSLVAHTNIARARAKLKLKDLRSIDWDGCPGKDLFIKTVGCCFDSENFKANSREGLTAQATRNALYRKVVEPLSWLATKVYGGQENTPLVPIHQIKTLRQRDPDDVGSLSVLQKQLEACGSFHMTSPNTEDFFNDLQRVAGYVEGCRRRSKTTKRIRVALLDSGCNTNISFFQESGRMTRLLGWKDCTPMTANSATDSFGHGTFMTKLLMRVAPSVDVYLIRVASNTEELENSEKSIAEAIEHAALHPDWRVDIISTSFGFPEQPGKSYKIISEAIEKVRRERDGSIIFLASAGNSCVKGEDFPARHHDVISVYAADASRIPLRSNPSYIGRGPKSLHSYGADIPPSILQDIQGQFPDMTLSSGTSIATAIASGIAATTLTYISTLPTSLSWDGVEEMCNKIYTKTGMEHMLYAMSSQIGLQQHFINPPLFWGTKSKPIQVLAEISRVSDIINKEG